MPRRRSRPGSSTDVLAPAHQLDDREREVGEAQRIGDRARFGPGTRPSAFESGSAGSFSPMRPARDRRCGAQRSGERTTRRSDGKPCASRKRAVDAVGGDHEVLDELLRAVLLVGGEIGDRVAVEDGARLDRLQIERAVFVARVLEDAGPTRSWSRRFSVEAGNGRERGRRRAFALEPGADARCRRAWRGCARARGRCSDAAHARRPGRSPSRRRRPARSSPSLSDVRSVESRSGSIGKICARGVDGGRVGARVVVDGRALADHANRRRRRRRGSSSPPPSSGSATVSWSRSRESSLSIDAQRSERRSLAPAGGSSGSLSMMASSSSASGENSARSPRCAMTRCAILSSRWRWEILRLFIA